MPSRWHQRHPRRAKRPRLARIGLPKDQHGATYDHECQQRPDVHHLADVVNGRDAAHDCRKETHQNRVLPGRAKLRVDGREKLFRSSPSLAIEYSTRVWPSSITSITLVSPARAPTVMTCEAVVSPRSMNARAMGASMLISRHGTMPVRTPATRMYKIVQIPARR